MTLLLKNLGRRFGDRTIFNDVSLTAGPGDAVAVVGPNGVGKTTLLRVLATALAPSEGEAWLGDLSIGAASAEVRKKVAWMPATDGGFVPRLNGRENLQLFASLRGITRRETCDRLARWQSFSPLALALETPYLLSSAGMRQALHLARAGLSRASLLLLDEPTRSLDAASARALREMLRDVARESIVVFSNHHDSALGAMATHEIELKAFA